MRKLFVLLFALWGCASLQKPSVASLDPPWGLTLSELIEPLAIVRWINPPLETPGASAPAALEQREIPTHCGDRDLYPASPQQSEKIFHIYRRALYDPKKSKAASKICRVRSFGDESICLISDHFDYAVISDLYEDGCGNLYRGLWKVKFLRQDENMNTLFSLGRTMRPKESKSAISSLEDGDTKAVESSEFLFLSPPFPGDLEKVRKLRFQARSTHRYDAQTHIFTRKP